MRIVDRLLYQVRDLSLTLRPSLLDDLGLIPALRWYLERQMQHPGLVIEFSAAPLPARLPGEIETVCFRVTQEAITNVIRHAQATHASVEFRCNQQTAFLSILDDGIGFDVPQAVKRAMRGASMGILGLQERVLLAGGRFDIESAPKQGTRIQVQLPLRPSQKRVERRSRRRLS
jgi:signal transduction histidine kinase